jgi:hypothetical protein
LDGKILGHHSNTLLCQKKVIGMGDILGLSFQIPFFVEKIYWDGKILGYHHSNTLLLSKEL